MANQPNQGISSDGKLMLRPPAVHDAPDLLRILGNPANMRHVPAGTLADLAAAQRQLDTWRAHWEQHGFGHWIVSTPDEPSHIVGFGGVFWREVPGWPLTLHIGFCFDASAWGKGLGSALARAGVDLAEHVDHPVLLGIVRPDNTGSLRVLAKAGMSPIGRLDEVAGEAPSVVMGKYP